MWDIFRYGFVCIFIGSWPTPTAAQQTFIGSLLGDNNNGNNNNPLIGALGIGSNNDQQNRFNNYNQYPNNNQYINNNNANRGLLSVLGGNANVNRPNTNHLNRNPNTGQINPNQNVNGLKNQVEEAEKLLERLKELNRLKKEKQDKEKNQGQASTDNDDQRNDNVSTNINANIDGHEKTGALKSMTKKKFYFKVNPVVPENEAAKYEQTVYFVD